MLRRKAGNIVEFRQLEAMLTQSSPPGLTAARREALWLRISSGLGEQDPAPAVLRFLPPRERWIAIPAGAGLAAAVVAGAVLIAEQVSSPTAGITAHAVGDVLVDGQQSNDVQPGAMLVARSSTWVSVGSNIRVGLDTGAVVRYDYANGSVALHLFSGDVTVAATTSGVNLNGDGWSAVLGPGTLVSASTVGASTTFQVVESTATLTFDGSTRTLGPSDPAVHIGNSGPATPSADAVPSAGGSGGSQLPSATDVASSAADGPSTDQSYHPVVASSSPTVPDAPTTGPASDPPEAVPQSPGQSAHSPANDPPGRLVEDGGNSGGSHEGTSASAPPAAPSGPTHGSGSDQGSPTNPSALGTGSGSGTAAGASPDSPGNPHDSGAATGNPHESTDAPANPHASDPAANAHASDPSDDPPAAGDGSGQTAVAPGSGSSGDAPGQDKTLAAPTSANTTTPSGSAPSDTQGKAANAPGHTGDLPDQPAQAPNGNSGNTPHAATDAIGSSGEGATAKTANDQAADALPGDNATRHGKT